MYTMLAVTVNTSHANGHLYSAAHEYICQGLDKITMK